MSELKRGNNSTNSKFTKVLVRYGIGTMVHRYSVSDPHMFLCGSGIPKMSICIRIHKGKI